MDTGFEGWQTNEGTLNAIEIAIIDTLIKDHDKADLVKPDDFVTDARDYLVRNKAVSQDGE